MPPLAQRVEVVEDRLDRVERLMQQLAADTDRFREENDRFREENDRFREKVERDHEEWARERRAMNRQWSDLAAKMGTVVEDIVAPSVRRMAREVFDCGEQQLFICRIERVRSDDRSRRREFDALYVGGRAVLLNETKSTPWGSDVRRFVRLVRSGEFFLYFPEYRDLPIVPVFSSLGLPDSLVTRLTRNGVYALAMGDEAMQVLNLDAVRKARADARP